MDFSAMHIHFSPLLPMSWIISLGIAGVVLMTLQILVRQRRVLWRALALVGLISILLNPAIITEKRESVNDVAALIIDESLSQTMGNREQRTEEARAYIQEKIGTLKNIELRTISAPINKALSNETALFGALESAMSDVPPARRAGVIILSDGQVHDIPELLNNYGPIHLLLTGEKDEKDRRILMTNAPAYGIVGQSIDISFKLEDTPNINTPAMVTIRYPDGHQQNINVINGEEQTISVNIKHAGNNMLEISTEPLEDELTPKNNRQIININGVRDRLRVLLVSGKPHSGGRQWRDLLTSDPGVDLIHFTILRDPSKQDATPQNEMSLIAFPVRELFETKLNEFDLIVFDQYKLSNILPMHFFNNIATFVENGGALLEASGPSFAGKDSVYNTDLSRIIPGAPTGAVLRKGFVPKISALGKHHPVTRNLSKNKIWGKWYRQILVTPQKGDLLMEGINNAPLLILDHVGDGRVAHIASDHIWMWARGHDGGGPYSELLRRVVHWLMKEPELDENRIDITINNDEIQLRALAFKENARQIILTRPDGTQEEISLQKEDDGWLKASIKAQEIGLYSIEDPAMKAHYTAVIGETNPPELQAVLTSPIPLTPLVKETKGAIFWLSETPKPDIRQIKLSSNYAGSSWLALRNNNSFIVMGSKETPLLPIWLAALSLIGLITFAWWREAK